MMTSRPVEGARIRYFWRIRIWRHTTSGPDGTGAEWGRKRAASLDRVPAGEMLACPPGLRRTVIRLIAGIVAMLAVGGCAVKHPTSNLVAGKVTFQKSCGSCHTLAHASTSGTSAPSL